MNAMLMAAGLLGFAAVGFLRRSVPDAAAVRLRAIRARGIGHRSRVPRGLRGSAFAGGLTGPAAARLVGLLAALAVALLLPAPLSLAAAPAAFAGTRAAVARLPAAKPSLPPPRMLATAADLLAACLEAGAVPATALAVTGACLPRPWGAHFADAGRALASGASAQQSLPETGALAPIAAVFRRSLTTGSAMTDQLTAVADQLRADDHFDRLSRAHRVTVLSALPLAFCMLPAFLLLAVIPAVAGLGTGLLR